MEAAAVWAVSRFGRSMRTPADALQVSEYAGRRRFVDARLVSAVHDTGTQIHVWTVNDPPAMERLLDAGVDGIVTDRPDLLNEVLRRRAGAAS